MHLILVTDIFGINQSIQDLAQTLKKTRDVNISIVDPFNGNQQNFTNENEAYQEFISRCGHHHYVNLVKSAAEKIIGELVIIGFSAGASAAWKFSNLTTDTVQKTTLYHLKHVIGFYPSQIRNQLDVKPCCEVTLIFPVKEPHFSLEETIQILSKKKRVHCFKTIYGHGFINPSSKNFSKEADQYFSEILSSMTEILAFNTLLTKDKIHFIRNNNEN